MSDYRLADLNIRFEETYDTIAKMASGYAATFDRPDIIVPVTPEDIAAERALDLSEHAHLPDRKLEPFAAFRCLGKVLPQLDGVVMHGCLVAAGDKGILFTARSGTGKTTHMMLWQQLLDDRMQIVNGDKPIVRFSDPASQIPFGYGTPWNGKENLGGNAKVGLTDVCLIERAEKNETVPMTSAEGLEVLMRQTYLSPDPSVQEKTLQLLQRMAGVLRFWKIRCNMELSAAETAYCAVFSNKPVEELPVFQNTAVPQYTVGEKIVSGVFAPNFVTDELVLTDLPFAPKKVFISCNDVLLRGPQKSGMAYYVNFHYDSTAKRMVFVGTVRGETVIPFGLVRSAQEFSAITVTDHSFSVKGLQMENQKYYFVGGKTYTFFACGE